jgi:hypothetical protein
MSVPWQADISGCSGSFWPAQRPNLVHRTDSSSSVPWLPASDSDTDWSTHEFVVREHGKLQSFGCNDSLIPSLLDRFAEYVRIFFGVIQDGGGSTDHGPVPPWQPFVQLVAASAIERLSGSLPPVEAAMIRRVTATAASRIRLSYLKSRAGGALQQRR